MTSDRIEPFLFFSSHFIEAHEISSCKDTDDTTRSKGDPKGYPKGDPKGNPKGNPKKFMVQKRKAIVGWGNTTYEFG